jgi:hypothetical protein
MIDKKQPTVWSLQIAMLLVTIVLVLQKTKYALLPSKETPALWAAEFTVIACVLILRSGWARDTHWQTEQGDLGTLANNFYEPRRDALISGTAIGFGVFGALWWAIATWSVVFYGMRRHVAGHGFFDFAIAALMGAITGGLLGAVAGLAAGHWWEQRHRRQRLARQVSHA